jgi:hypothetical protein
LTGDFRRPSLWTATSVGLLSALLNAGLIWILQSPFFQAISAVPYFFLGQGWERVWQISLIVLIGPIAESFAFVFLIEVIGRRWGYRRAAAVVTVLVSLAHIGRWLFWPIAILPLFSLSALYFLRQRPSGLVAAGIGVAWIHVVHNLLAVVTTLPQLRQGP